MPLPPSQLPGPVFLKIEYTSPYAPHVMIRPLRDAWVDSGDILGLITPWSNASNIDVNDMVTAFLTDMADLFNDTMTFDAVTLYTQPDPDLPATPQASVATVIPGTRSAVPNDKATEVSLAFRDTEFHNAKIVMLDQPVGNDFSRHTPFNVNAIYAPTIAHFVSDDEAWASRRGFRPGQFTQQTATLNEKLRRAYRMT